MSMAAVSQKLDSRYLEALGPLRPLVDDDSLTEIMVNGPDMVYVERKGKILLTDIRFDDEAHLMRVIDTIGAAVGRRIDSRTPLMDARLLDGSRVNAAIPPVDAMGADHSSHPPAMPEAGGKSVMRGEHLERGTNECDSIVFRSGRVDPWQPLPQVLAVALHRREHFTGVMFLQQAEFEVLAEQRGEHDYVARFA